MKTQLLADLIGHRNPIFTVEASQKPGIVFTGGNDAGVVEWSVTKHAFIKVLMPVKSSVYALHAPLLGNNVLLTGERSGVVSVFDFVAQSVKHHLELHQQPVFDIQSNLLRQEIYTASEDGRLGIWSATDYSLQQVLIISQQGLRCITVSVDGKQLAVSGKDGRIRVYDTASRSLIKEWEAHLLPVFSLKYTPDGKTLLSGSRDAHLKIWSTDGYELKKEFAAHMYAVNTIAFHPAKPYFATGSMDKSIKIWSSADYKLLKKLDLSKGEGHHKSVNKLCWMPDTGQLISVGDDKRVLIWDLDSSD